MNRINVAPLPDQALLSRYREKKAYMDCYRLEVAHAVSLPQYVEAFYTTPLFKLERIILAVTARKPSTDADARLLAQGESTKFAAWTVEGRTGDQILLCDFLGRTRSWLMCVDHPAGARLYFGSAIVPRSVSATGRVSLGFGFHLLLGFHRLYSRALLSSAASRLRRLQG